MFEVIERTTETESKGLSEDTKTNLERNLSILDKFTIKGDDAQKSWQKIEKLIKK